MPEQLSKIREEPSKPVQEEPKENKSKFNWTSDEKQTCLRDYSCEIIVDNGSYEDVHTKKAPTDAWVVKYMVGDKVCFDLTRGSQYKLFDMYYDKFKGGLKSIDFGNGMVKPNIWGYKATQKKKRK